MVDSPLSHGAVRDRFEFVVVAVSDWHSLSIGF